MAENTCSCSCGTDCGDQSCVSNSAPSGVYACAGASNVGIISLELAKALHTAGRYKMGCSVCVAVGDCGCGSEYNESSPRDLLIDGCKVGCLKKIFDKLGKTHYHHVVVTQLGVKKEPTLEYPDSLVAVLMNKLTEKGL